MTSRPLAPDRFRRALGQYPTGVSIVTAIDDEGRPVGFAVGSFTSVSLDPPLIAFLPDKRSSTWPRIATSGRFCVNVLGAEQEAICRTFSAPVSDRFSGLRWRPGATGSPILAGAVAWIDCEVDQVHEAGDHFIVVGRVLDLDAAEDSLPLLFFRGGYGKFAPLSLAAGEPRFGEYLRLVDAARPEMERLTAELGVRCVAAALDGDSVILLASAGEAAPEDADGSLIGQRSPAVPTLGTLWMAFADDSAVDGWLRRGGVQHEHEHYRTRLAQVRRRGYSVGLQGPQHLRFEALMAKGDSAKLDQDGLRLIRSLPYDPIDYSPLDGQPLRSVHAPVFDRDGRVALALAAFAPARTRPELGDYAERVVHVADLVTQKTGGSPPANDSMR